MSRCVNIDADDKLVFLEKYKLWLGQFQLSPGTVKNNLWVASKFRDDVKEVTQESVNRFLKAYPRGFVKGSLKRYFKFAGISGIELIKIREPDRMPRKEVTRIELGKLVDTLPSKISNMDVYWFFKLAYLTGARKNEILTLTLNEVDFKSDEIMLRTKGGKHRVCDIPHGIMEEFRKYLLELKGTLGNERCLFSNSMNTHSAYANIRRYLEKMPFEERNVLVKTHNFRRAVANELFEKSGGNIKMVQTILGHASIQTTDKYIAEWETEKLRKKGEELLNG